MDPLSAACSALIKTVPGRFMLAMCLWLGFVLMSGGGSVLSAVGNLETGSGSGKSGKGVTVHDRGDHVLIRWSGTIDRRMTRALENAFHARHTDRRKIILSLDSAGGLVSEGEAVIESIKGLRRTHTVETIVEDGRICASMCVPIYATGGHRLAHPNARFMFHSVRVRSSIFFQPSHKHVKKIEERATEDLFDEHLRASGINERWLENLRTTMGGADVWFNARELHQKRVGIVDELVPTRAR